MAAEALKDASPNRRRTGKTQLLRQRAAIAFALACIAACGSTTAIAVEPEMTPDGLRKIEAARVDLAYVRPGTEWSRYKSAQVLPLVVPLSVHLPEGYEIALSAEVSARLQQMHADIWRAQLNEQGFAVVDAPRADSVIISAELTDMISNVPDADISGSVAIRITTADGLTHKVLATASDRRFARYLTEEPTLESNLRQVRDAFQNWAHILTQELRDRADAPKVDLWLCLNERKLCPPDVLNPQ